MAENEPERLTTPPPSTSLSEDEAAARISALDGGEAQEAEQPEQRPQPRGMDGRFAPVDPLGIEAKIRDRPEKAAPEAPAEEEGPAEPEISAPEFWSAEDREFWANVPAEVRPLIKKYEEQRKLHIEQKQQEAAAERQKAHDDMQRANQTIEEAARWWQQTGPALVQSFQSKWQGVDWNRLAQENPAQWAVLKQQAENEASLLAEANRRAQQDIQRASQLADERLQHAKRDSHMEMARKYPDYFGSHQVSEKTYEQMGRFLHSHGIPVDRINQIHEAPILEIALKAMRWDEAQKEASAVTSSGAAKTTANAAPKKVQPGPPARRGNQQTEAIRQVRQRFLDSGGQDTEAAVELIQRLGL